MYLALDIETGGIGLPCSLLTGYYAVYDRRFVLVDDLSLSIKPDDGMYHLTAEGMAVNKIDIVEHNATAITLKEAGTALYTWLKRMYEGLGSVRFTPVGQGVRQDIEFMIASKLVSRGSWEQFVGHQMFDTASVTNFLKLLGKIPQETSGSLSGMMEYLKLEWQGEPHTAKADAIAGVQLLQALKELAL